ncbi:HAMP domain-containing sensor histidine kinase [Pseudodesulfovibrio sp. S3]|uniref:sensor histidine kinase n=1 Tax=Pseudodesulfovibrio sp. S3 TaxID=2283629 RepID=UPI00100746CC|nr:HAMP domain-containing sensor histidine kinase [Pseudodesulfovibrio sp. S3]MCJ2163408.1 HAMP domain-containing histidine kinase [Pseudodesulfovibrio sp. S3-i]RWU06645.1 sensor histidine kinase [Pseudodesulfovibrio sp. S3]
MITCAVLVVGYTFFLSQYLTRGFGLFVEFRLEEVAENYLHAFAEDPEVPLPVVGPVKGYGRYEDLHADIRSVATPEQIKNERFTYIHKGNIHYEVCAVERPDGKTVYLVFTTTESELSAESVRRFDFYYLYTPIVAGLLSIAAVLFLAFRMFKWITRPVEELHEWAIGLSPENLDKEPLHFKYDELNNLANLILTTSRRLVAGVEREKRFQKYTSHELRTPIAILQNNLELLERLGITEDNRYQTSHARMVKAVRNMRNLTTSLLWLARESNTPLPVEDFEIVGFIREIIDDNAYLLEGKDVSLTTCLAPVSIRCPKTLAHIVLVNLVRNAFQHTYEGTITIKADSEQFEISNQAEISEGPASDDMDGYGLGLQLSIQLAKKIGWRIQVIEEGKLFLVRVIIG